MKTTKILLLLLTFFVSQAAMADDLVLQVWQADGKVMNINLNEQPVTTYSDGQLIITTHNTSLLRILEPKGAFIINVDLNGEREIRSICKILRTQKNHNNQDRYLKGVLDGVPYMGSLDLDEIAGSYYNREAQ